MLAILSIYVLIAELKSLIGVIAVGIKKLRGGLKISSHGLSKGNIEFLPIIFEIWNVFFLFQRKSYLCHYHAAEFLFMPSWRNTLA